jgi:hypothetical protein
MPYPFRNYYDVAAKYIVSPVSSVSSSLVRSNACKQHTNSERSRFVMYTNRFKGCSVQINILDELIETRNTENEHGEEQKN